MAPTGLATSAWNFLVARNLEGGACGGEALGEGCACIHQAAHVGHVCCCDEAVAAKLRGLWCWGLREGTE